jgi:putative peptide zinc metalloprotease protein
LDEAKNVGLVTMSPTEDLTAGQSDWQQLASLTPALKSGIEINQHQYRGVFWYMLTDPLNGQHYRCTNEAHRFLMLLDGQRTVAEALQLALTDQDESELLQVEILRLVASLHTANLLEGGPVDVGETRSGINRTQSRWAQVLMRPLAISFPLVDPDQFLARLVPWVRPLFSRMAFLIWMLLIGWAVSQAAMAWPELVVHWDARFKDPGNLLTLLLLYPLVKGLHELGHGLAIKVWGGETHEMGIMLLVFVPVPYVDASASNAFYQKHRRMLVGAAGIMVELSLAAIAMLLWTELSPGLSRDLCFNIVFIGGVSTVLFNGNPLLRFDGYYVFADFVEIPNLGTRSIQYLGYLLRRYVIGIKATMSPVTAQGERGWLFIYGLAAGIYRLFISLTIAMLVAGQFFVFGIILAVWFVFMQLLLPITRSVHGLVPEIVRQGVGLRASLILLIFCGSLTGLIFVKPFEHSSYAEGMVVIPRDAHVRSGVNGFVVQVSVENGQWVKPGDTLFRLENHELSARIRIIEARKTELEARYSSSLQDDRLQADIHKIELQALRAEFDELQRQSNELDVISNTDGRFAMLQPSDTTGRYVAKGDVLGYVIDLKRVEARVVITQSQLDQIRHKTRYIEVRLTSEPNRILRGELLQSVPLAIKQLPARMLGSQAGGRIPVDARDPTGLKTIEPVFQLDIGLPVRSRGDYLGQSLVVRFVHLREPVAQRIFGLLRGQILKRFSF